MLENSIGLLGALAILGLLVERLTEMVIAPFFDQIPKLNSFKWVQVYVAILLGCLVSFSLQLDILPTIGSNFGIEFDSTILGLILTGLGIGGGSEFWHKLFGK